MSATLSPVAPSCRICAGQTESVGVKPGCRTGRSFELRRCAACGFAFVANPWSDYKQIYDADYYQGRGSDPLVDYLFELEHPKETVREFEWRGIVQAVGHLTALSPKTRWLDFGCGNGGLVRYCRETLPCEMVGFEEGWICERARQQGIPILESAALDRESHSFDIVTAIEVIEHAIDPAALFRRVRSLLRPGGLFFFTTGNAAPFADKLLEWRYVAPEIHVSFFEPRTLRLLLEKTGFQAAFPGFLPGHENIIKFKLLKNFRQRRQAAWFRLMPWKMAARFCDSRLNITALPIGWAATE
jgi:SAM-dependent methyltransferase